jgi:hypothetical protein
VSFNEESVQTKFNALKQFAADHELGRASKILMRDRDTPPWAVHGVGLQWDVQGSEPVRNAIAGGQDDIAELKRRLEEWKDGK